MKLAAVAVLLALLVPGCANVFLEPDPVRYGDRDGYQRDTTGEAAAKWPDLSGARLSILDNGAFVACDKAVAQFKVLTGVNATCEDGGDAGGALTKVLKDRGAGTYDIVYGLDNALLRKAETAGVLVAYKPELADRIASQYVFFNATGPWNATPVDHGYVAINVDLGFRSNGTRLFDGTSMDTLARVREYADHLVVQDPANSSPGLAFLLTTIARFGENPEYGTPYYDWKAYWRDLLNGTKRLDRSDPPCVLVAKDWGEAYEQHFSAGYNSPPGGQGAGDKPIVVSYTNSPAYEAYYGRPNETLAHVVLEDRSTWHQIQTMAIVAGTPNLEAAQAWIEYTLTDHFQRMAAPENAVYPVVAGIETDSVYGERDPEPGTFTPAAMDYATIGANLDRWLKEWRSLYESTVLNCRL